MNIMIVDSNTGRQRQLKTVLSSLGFKASEIELAVNIKDASLILRKKRLDWCFIAIDRVDSQLTELLNEIAVSGFSKTSSFSKPVPVIFFSSTATKELVTAGIDAGASGFLAYPFSAGDVESTMKLVSSRLCD